MSLIAAIEESCQCFVKPPSNEKNTELRVVYPLLLAMGYTPHDIDGGNRDVAGYFPDYTLLPEQQEFAWYVEVKAWLETLDDKAKHQAIDYANRNGKRWVVLTNGRVWRLYDNYVRGVADDKLIVEASLESKEEIAELLTALSKQSIRSNKLEDYISQMRLKHILGRELVNVNSKLLQAIHDRLRTDFSLETVKHTDVVAFFKTHLRSSIASPLEPLIPEPPRKPKTTRPVSVPSPSASEEYSFDKFVQQQHALGRKKPAGIRFINRAEGQFVTTWAEFVTAVVEWVAQQNKLPQLPFQPTQGNRYFLNTKPSHANADELMRSYKEVQTSSGSVYVNTNTSTMEKISWLCALCEAANISTSDIFVRLQ